LFRDFGRAICGDDANEFYTVINIGDVAWDLERRGRDGTCCCADNRSANLRHRARIFRFIDLTRGLENPHNDDVTQLVGGFSIINNQRFLYLN
jgi:hypothetical protein